MHCCRAFPFVRAGDPTAKQAPTPNNHHALAPWQSVMRYHTVCLFLVSGVLCTDANVILDTQSPKQVEWSILRELQETILFEELDRRAAVGNKTQRTPQRFVIDDDFGILPNRGRQAAPHRSNQRSLRCQATKAIIPTAGTTR